MKYLKNRSIKDFSYIKVGGIVEKIYVVENEKEMIEVLNNEPNVRIVGGGSKILFAFNNDYSTYLIDRNDYIIEKKNTIVIGSAHFYRFYRLIYC